MISNIKIILQLVRADFFERVRRYSFLVTMVAAIYLGYAVNAGYVVISLGKYRGIYNSAWVGTLVAQSTCMFITLVGFYIVKNAIERDRRTGVGQILASTRLSKLFYLLGKAISNFGVLAAIVVVQAIAAVVMILLSGEKANIDITALLLPFLLITLPCIAFVAAVAVFFESVKWLSGGLGNVIYFFLIQAFLVVSMEAKLPALDSWFLQDVETSMQTQLIVTHPDYKGEFSFNAGPRKPVEDVKVFQWDGIKWTTTLLVQRTAWYGYAFLLVLFAIPFFERFNETRIKTRKRHFPAARSKNFTDGKDHHIIRLGFGKLSSLFPKVKPSSRIGQLLFNEIRLMLKGVHWVWYVVAVASIVTSLSLPIEDVKNYILPLSWIVPILLWSKMGVRESHYHTNQLLFSAPHFRSRQIVAIWLAGVLLAMFTGMGAGIHLMLSGEWQTFFGFFGGVLFIPSLSLVLGVWSGSSKLFEALYSLLWYLGPLNHIPQLDFTGGSSSAGIAGIYIVLSVVCICLAYLGRQRQVEV